MTLDTTVHQKEENIELKSSHWGCKLCMVKIRVKCTATDGALNFLFSAEFYLELKTVWCPRPTPYKSQVTRVCFLTVFWNKLIKMELYKSYLQPETLLYTKSKSSPLSVHLGTPTSSQRKMQLLGAWLVRFGYRRYLWRILASFSFKRLHRFNWSRKIFSSTVSG